ncbi:MAG: GAF domain-containing protein [Anaerolineales bacterium]|nr:GAF domain-containing protein [Anaerolineales bacterium]
MFSKTEVAHQLLQKQLESLGLDAKTPPRPDEWGKLLQQIATTYNETDSTVEQWRQAYDQLREDMEGSFESLRRSSVHLITSERDKLQAVVGSLGEGLCALNENGCLLFLNPEGERLLGWEQSDLLGQLLLDWVMPSGEEATKTEDLFEHIRSGQTYANSDAVFIRQDGRHFPASYTLDPITRDGEFNGAVLIFRDITARKRAEEERERKLRETLLLNRVIATATSTLDLNTALQTICDELASFFNLPQAAFALLNKERNRLEIVAEYLEKGQVSALGTVIPLANNTITQDVLRTRKPVVVEDAQTDPRQPYMHDIARRRGTRSMMIIPLLVRGEVLGTLGLNATEYRKFTDYEMQLAQNVAAAASQALANAQLYAAVQQELAERRRAEEQLAQARDKALEASRLKSELIAKVSHELRTPLTSIMGFVEMLQLGIYGEITADQDNTLAKVMMSTENLVVLVNDLLDLAQLEAGTLKLDVKPFKPAALVEQMESTMRIIAESKGLALNCDIDQAMPEQLLGDDSRLYQILINLVNNAVKFTEEGAVRVRFYLPDNQTWCIEVCDTGPGIPKHMISHVFDEFRQVDFSPTRKHKGVGLGLAIVKQITSVMKGEITLDSELGEGSTFSVILPLRTADHPAT